MWVLLHISDNPKKMIEMNLKEIRSLILVPAEASQSACKAFMSVVVLVFHLDGHF